MATITVEIGKKGKKKERAISFLICQGKTKKRIPTQIFVTDSELTSNGKKVKEPTKAKLIEQMRRQLQDKLFALSLDLVGQEVDASYIVERLTVHRGDIDFFEFAENWLKHAGIKSKKNYRCMLNMLEAHLKRRRLSFSAINFSMLKGFEEHLDDRPRAKSMYLGLIRHLYREAMLQYNTDHELVISNDPFLRYKVPRQQIRKGVRALTLDDLLKIYRFEGRAGGRAQLARDAFILSFCLMGMNSVDMYECTTYKNGVIKYNRAKTKDRRSDGAYIEVRVHPFIMDLMRKYQGKGRVFSFSARYADSSVFNANINQGLKAVGEAVGIEDLEFYQARHTFATLSRNMMKFSKSDVDEALNHVGTMGIADVYITKDFSIINENNFKLIDKVFGLENTPISAG